MQTLNRHLTRQPVPARALLPLVVALLAAAQPASAQQLITNTIANDSFYNYNTVQGAVAAGGTSSGSSGTGNPTATSTSSYAGGTGNFAATSAATGSADYATGGLHATALSSGTYGDARAFTRLDDDVIFHIAGATATTVTNVLIDLTLTGTISELQNAGYLYNFAMFGSGSGASVGWTTQFYDSPTDARNYVGWAVSGGAGEPSGFESWELLSGTATEKHFRGVLAVTGADKEYGLSTSFNLHCSGGTNCDFGNSAHLNFELPTGVTFTSASGLLLSGLGGSGGDGGGGTVPAVPEPGTYALMLAGLGLTGWFVRRRRE